MTRMNRELLKQAWLSTPADKNKVEIREIRVISNLLDPFIGRISDKLNSSHCP